MAKDRETQLKKIGQTKLTEEQRILIAQNLDTPFFKLIEQIILPSRATQLAMTSISTAQTESDLWYYKGRLAEAGWLRKYLKDQSENIDDTDYENNDGDDIDAEDDDPEA